MTAISVAAAHDSRVVDDLSEAGCHPGRHWHRVSVSTIPAEQ